MSEVESIFTRDWVKDRLTEGICAIEFEKLDGTTRKARATLSETQIPSEAFRFNDSRKKKPEETIAYYDLDADGWRSFRVANLRKVDPQDV